MSAQSVLKQAEVLVLLCLVHTNASLATTRRRQLPKSWAVQYSTRKRKQTSTSALVADNLGCVAHFRIAVNGSRNNSCVSSFQTMRVLACNRKRTCTDQRRLYPACLAGSETLSTALGEDMTGCGAPRLSDAQHVCTVPFRHK